MKQNAYLTRGWGLVFNVQQFDCCLLCSQAINESISWQQLLTRSFLPSICNRCAQKFKEIHNYVDEVYCIYEYNEAMRSYFQRYKFLKDVLLAHVFRSEVKKVFHTFLHNANKQFGWGTKRVVVPIPMHKQQLEERTFAQVDELLNAANIPYTHLLQKNTTNTQASKNRAQRIVTKNLFSSLQSIEIEHVLLFDDIKTTGTTLKLAEQVLLENGVKKVTPIALAAVI